MTRKLVFVFFLAFILRIFLIPVAFHGDLYNNQSWGEAFLKYGASGYYEQQYWTHSAPNQPPLYILLFGFTSFLFKNINSLFLYLNNNLGVFPSSLVWFWQGNGNILLLKMPGVLADLGIGFFLYFFFKEKGKESLGFKLTLVWLFNPISFYNSAIWGQTDSIVNLLGLLSVYYLTKKQLIPSMLYIVLSLLFKGSLVVLLPIIGLVWVLQKYELKKWFLALLLSFSLAIFASVWFHLQFDLPIWLFNLYSQRIFPGEIGYLTANAFNFWYLVNPGKILDNTKYFGLTAHTVGYLISYIIILVAIIKNRKKITQEKRIFYLLAISALVSFMFFTRIHERYLYPFFPIATLLIGLIPDLIVPYLVLSFVFLLNMYNLFWAPGIPFLQNLLVTTAIPGILSLVNLLVFGYIIIRE